MLVDPFHGKSRPARLRTVRTLKVDHTGLKEAERVAISSFFVRTSGIRALAYRGSIALNALRLHPSEMRPFYRSASSTANVRVVGCDDQSM